MNKYPIYIISKNRADTRLTSKSLEQMKIPYSIVIEPQEFDMYAKVINPDKILQLPFSNLGQGSIPARNWVWDHSLSIGAKRHWILDDNINGFGRLQHNKKTKVCSHRFFEILENFVDRYKNVGMAGCEYDYFLPRKVKHKPYRLNTRIYSNILIKNDLPHRWRGKYNEDTDLSLRVLKDGWCTILFQAFYAHKTPTLIMKGGNTDQVYGDSDNRMEFADSIVEQHPDVAKKVWRYNRWHHEIDYSPFKKNKLEYVDGFEIPKEPNNYGLVLRKIGGENDCKSNKACQESK